MKDSSAVTAFTLNINWLCSHDITPSHNISQSQGRQFQFGSPPVLLLKWKLTANYISHKVLYFAQGEFNTHTHARTNPWITFVSAAYSEHFTQQVNQPVKLSAAFSLCEASLAVIPRFINETRLIVNL